MIQQPRQEPSQQLAAGGGRIGHELGLVNSPLITEETKPSLPHYGIDSPGQAVDDLDPGDLGERIGQLPSGSGITQNPECVVSESNCSRRLSICWPSQEWPLTQARIVNGNQVIRPMWIKPSWGSRN
jgi:hypothetical protein